MDYKTMMEIAKLKAHGASIPEIAKLVPVSESTVRRKMRTEVYRIVEEETLRELVRQAMQPPEKEKPVQALPTLTIPKPITPIRERKKRPRKNR